MKYITHSDGSTRITVGVKDTTEDIEYYSSSWNDTGETMTADAWILLELKNIDWDANTYDIFREDSVIANDAAMQSAGVNQDVVNIQQVSDNGAMGDLWIDNYIVRNWRAVEPAWGSWGSEETATSIKTIMGVPIANIKTVNGVPIANVKSFLGVSNVS